MDMFRLDFSRGTVEKINPGIPPRGWHEPSPQPRDTSPASPAQRQGRRSDAPVAPADTDEE